MFWTPLYPLLETGPQRKPECALPPAYVTRPRVMAILLTACRRADRNDCNAHYEQLDSSVPLLCNLFTMSCHCDTMSCHCDRTLHSCQTAKAAEWRAKAVARRAPNRWKVSVHESWHYCTVHHFSEQATHLLMAVHHLCVLHNLHR